MVYSALAKYYIQRNLKLSRKYKETSNIEVEEGWLGIRSGRDIFHCINITLCF